MTTLTMTPQGTEAALARAWATVHDLQNERGAWPEQLRTVAATGDTAALHELFCRRTALQDEITIAHLVMRQCAVAHWTVMLRQAEADVAATREAGHAAYADYNKGFNVPRDDAGAIIPPPPAMVAHQRAQEAVQDAQLNLQEAERMRESQFAAVAAGQ